MITVSVTEAKARFYEFVKRADSGEIVEITKYGKARARLERDPKAARA
jgi:prevent-host-death family protein